MAATTFKSPGRISWLPNIWVSRSGETHFGQLLTAFGFALLILATAAAIMAAIL